MWFFFSTLGIIPQATRIFPKLRFISPASYWIPSCLSHYFIGDGEKSYLRRHLFGDFVTVSVFYHHDGEHGGRQASLVLEKKQSDASWQ